MSIYEETNFEDFTAEDRGGYKHPETVGEYSYSELEAKVLAAIDGRYRTLMRIKIHAGLDRAFDLSPVIEGMELDKKIRREENGQITAFFRYEQMPTRFWLNGDGTVEAEFDESFIPDRWTVAGKGQRSISLTERDDSRSRIPNERPRNIDPYKLEEIASTHTDSLAIATELGVGRSALIQQLRAQPGLKAAFDRGRAKFAASQASLRTEIKPTEEKIMQTATARATNGSGGPDRSPKGVTYTAEMFRQAAAKGMSKAGFARQLGVGATSIDYQLKKPELAAAWKEGLAEKPADSNEALPSTPKSRAASSNDK